jgi:hypothetical protein
MFGFTGQNTALRPAMEPADCDNFIAAAAPCDRAIRALASCASSNTPHIMPTRNIPSSAQRIMYRMAHL